MCTGGSEQTGPKVHQPVGLAYPLDKLHVNERPYLKGALAPEASCPLNHTHMHRHKKGKKDSF